MEPKIRLTSPSVKLSQIANSLERSIDSMPKEHRAEARRLLKDMRRLVDNLERKRAQKIEKKLSGIQIRTLPTGRTRILLKQR